MRNILFIIGIAAVIIAATSLAQPPVDGSYKVLKTVKVGGPGGWDYVNADPDARRLYIARRDQTTQHLTVYDLDTLQPVGEVPMVSAHGAVIDPKSGHGIASSKPITLFDRKTLQVIKKIDVMGNPDGLMYDPFNRRVHDLSHQPPYDTVIDPADGTVVGTIDLGGQPEQAQSDGKGTIYVDIEDKSAIAVVDAKTLTVKAKYDITGSGGTCAGLALDAKNQILFAACRNPQNMVILRAKDGKIITTFPIGPGTDGAAFNPKTMEAFSSNGGDGTLTVIKENSPTSFVVEQTLQTKPGARTMALDPKTGNIYLVTAEFGPPPTDGKRGARGALLPDTFSILVVGK